MKPNFSVLLDTSFFIRFLNDADRLFKNADGYFRYFIQNDIPMIISSISVAEYSVGGDIHQLPLKNLKILPFNLNHATRAGEFARLVFRNRGLLKIRERNIIPNDSKLFAQADAEENIAFYLSSDQESIKIYNFLKKESNVRFQFIDLNVPYGDTFGVLEL